MLPPLEFLRGTFKRHLEEPKRLNFNSGQITKPQNTKQDKTKLRRCFWRWKDCRVTTRPRFDLNRETPSVRPRRHRHSFGVNPELPFCFSFFLFVLCRSFSYFLFDPFLLVFFSLYCSTSPPPFRRKTLILLFTPILLYEHSRHSFSSVWSLL